MNDRDTIRQAVVEFIGPFALVFLGVSSILVSNGDLVAVALAHGLAIGLMVAAAGHISGGQFNPAVTVGLVATGKVPVVRGAIIIVSQLLGAVVAALAVVAIFPAAQRDAIELGTPMVADGFTVGAVFLAEAIMTFFLMFVIYGTAVDKRGAKAIAPLAIGLIISAGVMALGPVSGAAMNPSRAFGPALVQNFWSDQWVYWVAPIVGALVASFLYNYLLMEGEITPEAGDVEVEPTTARREETRRRRNRR